MGTRYGELTESERRQILRLRLARISRSEIGRMNGRDEDKGTISRELRRNALLKRRLSKLHQPNDAPIPRTALVRIERLLDRLELVLRQIKAVEAARDEVLTKAAPANEAENMILALARSVSGQGLLCSWCVRPMCDRYAIVGTLASTSQRIFRTGVVPREPGAIA